MAATKGIICLAICTLCIWSVESQFTKFLSEEEVVDYLVGSPVPDHSDTVKYFGVNMTYWMTNVVIGRMIENDSNYTLNDGEVDAMIYSKYGHIRGNLEAVIDARNTDGSLYKVVLNGSFILYGNDSLINVSFLLPKPDGKISLEITSCKGTYSSLNMIFSDPHYKDPQDLTSLSYWLTQALGDSLKELYCKALKADLAKQDKSKVVRGIVEQILWRIAIQSALGR